MMSKTCLAVGALVMVVAGCGSGNDDAATADDDEPTTTTAPTTTAPTTTTAVPPAPTTTAAGGGGSGSGGATISLTVEVTAPGAPTQKGTVSCAASAEGTGFLAGPAAGAACDHLRAEAAATRRLVEGQPPDLLCTEIYGGPEVAHITGTIGGQPIDTKITRTDGCGIADWTNLGALLTPAS